MHRHYDGDRVREVLEKLRNLEREDGVIMNIGADLIVGFPGETEIDFDDTLEIVEKYGITQLHAFPFSAHVDHYHVPAGLYPDQVPNHIAQQRLKKLLKTGENIFEDFARKNIGKKVRILVEKCDPNKLNNDPIIQPSHYSGWAENYLSCNETNIELLPNQEIVRGKVIEGIYLHPIKEKTNEE